MRIVVNTNRPELVRDNPYVDEVNRDREGIFLGYPDPIHCKDPTKHHILSDWDVVENAIGLKIPKPDLKPEIWMRMPKDKNGRIGVQAIHKGHWHKKKIWPYFHNLFNRGGFEAIPKVPNVLDLVRLVASYKAVICSEGGISHIAKAVGTPAVVIFGGFADPVWSGYDDHVNMTNKMWCSYCYNPKPCLEKIERFCMREIRPWKVLNGLEALL